MKGIFIFRRDLRLFDNNGLNKLLEECDEVLPIFIFDPRQIEKKKNEYFSDNCVQFLIQSLLDLNQELNKLGSALYYFYGDQPDILSKIYSKYKFDILAMNTDITPFSKKRDADIAKWSVSKGIKCIQTEDTNLLPLGSVKTGGNEIYKVYTPYFNVASKIETPKPIDLINKKAFIKLPSSLKTIDFDSKKLHSLYKPNDNVPVFGGRHEGLKILSSIDKFKNYNHDRDYPYIPTTMLSAYLKFGCISIREFKDRVLFELGNGHTLFKQVYWREFYYNIANSFPKVFGNSFKEKYDNIKWDNNREWFNAWKQGLTGCPFVDAGMRQLNQTGFMHNRLRMVVSMFLTKDLLIDWKWGEKYFATQLVDYDPANNNGGWQWSASTGTDSQPYFRIFNPYTMMLRLDKDGLYTKKWIPELKDVPMKALADWENEYKNYPDVKYPKPIISHSEQRIKALERYKVL